MNQFAAQWAVFRRPRSFLGSVLAVVIAVFLLVVGLGIVLLAAVVAIPVGLIAGAVLWVRARLPHRRADGRRNVRVIGAGPAAAER